MDTLELRRVEVVSEDEHFIEAVTLINGHDLRALVIDTQRDALTARYESEAVLHEYYSSLDEFLDPAVRIAFLAAGDIAPPSRLWQGSPDECMVEFGRVAVLTCTCGCFGCGGATAQIEFDAETVTWSDFYLANSPTKVPIGPYRFDRSSYDAAINAL